MRLDDSTLSMDLFSPVCSRCRHLDLSSLLRGEVRCRAFVSIPKEIWTGQQDHTTPWPGDRGILFQEAERE